jgi:hypothetical protein
MPKLYQRSTIFGELFLHTINKPIEPEFSWALIYAPASRNSLS